MTVLDLSRNKAKCRYQLILQHLRWLLKTIFVSALLTASVVLRAEGMNTDLDGDGLATELDICPASPKGLGVDVNGCVTVSHNASSTLLLSVSLLASNKLAGDIVAPDGSTLSSAALRRVIFSILDVSTDDSVAVDLPSGLLTWMPRQSPTDVLKKFYNMRSNINYRFYDYTENIFHDSRLEAYIAFENRDVIWVPNQILNNTIDPTLDYDLDGDGYTGYTDAFPSEASAAVDTDQDGKPDDWLTTSEPIVFIGPPLILDDDDDNDNVLDIDDAFPLNAEEWADTDGDGIGDNSDAFIFAITNANADGMSLTIEPPSADSRLSITRFRSDPRDLPQGYEGINKVAAFSLRGGDPLVAAAVMVQVDFGVATPANAIAYKISDRGLTVISGASVGSTSVRYTITDNGPLDTNQNIGEIDHSVTVAVPFAVAVPVPVSNVGFFWWLVASLMLCLIAQWRCQV